MADPVKLDITDFCCISRATISLERRGLELITGENLDTNAADNNGAGKSSLAKALCWGLYGDTIDGDRHDEVIRHGAKRAVVEVTLRHGDELWRITRKRAKGKPELKLEYKLDAGWPDWTGNAKELQAKIDDLMARDFTAFCHTSLFGQGDVNRFFSSSNLQQHETLNKILRNEKYRRAEQRLRENQIKAATTEVARLAAKVESTQARIQEYDLEALERQRDQWQAEQDEAREQLLQEVNQLVAQVRTAGRETKRRKAELERELEGSRARVGDLPAKEAELEAAQAALDNLQKGCNDAALRVRELELEERPLLERSRRLSGKRCPECNTLLSKGDAAKHVNELQGGLERVRSALLEARENLEVVQEQRGCAGTTLGEVRDDLQHRRRLRENLSAMEARLARMQAEGNALGSQLKAEAESKLARAREMAEAVNPFEEAVESARARLKELKAEVVKLGGQLVEQQKLLAHYEFWVRGFGLRGLPSMLLDSSMPYITQRANEYLQTLADGDITMEISTQRELKRKGEMRDEITTACTIEGVPGVKPSHGQKRKLEIAVDLALVDLAATREAQSNLLVMDEVLDGLDSEGVQRVLRLLRELRGERSSILVITHEPELAPAFERQLHVVKKDKASTVTEVK